MPCIAITKRATGRQNPETHIDCRHQRIPAHFSRRLLRIDDRGQDHTVESAIPPPRVGLSVSSITAVPFLNVR